MFRVFQVFSPIDRRRYVSLSFLSFVGMAVIWCTLAYGKVVPSYFLPSPTAVIRASIILFTRKAFLYDILISLLRITLGFSLSTLIALPLGVLIGVVASIEAFIRPLFVFIRYLPVPALLPFCILWFGVGELEKLVVVFLGVFFQLVILVADIAKVTPADFIDLGRTLGASENRLIMRIVVPNAAPQIFDVLQTTMGWAWGWVLVAELVGADRGIGFMILRSERYLLSADMAVGLLTIGLIGLGFDLTFKIVRRYIFRWA